MKKAFLNLFTAEGRRHEVPTSNGPMALYARNVKTKTIGLAQDNFIFAPSVSISIH